MDVGHSLKTRLYLASLIILLVGMGSAVAIYINAGEDTGDVLAYVMADGQAYPIGPEYSKQYRHDLEIYGGKAAVLADEFERWFDGLWRGKSLAFTVGF